MEVVTSGVKWDDILINCNWVVARWQYTLTHKQYIEQYNSLISKSAGRAPSLRVLCWHLPHNRGKSTGS